MFVVWCVLGVFVFDWEGCLFGLFIEKDCLWVFVNLVYGEMGGGIVVQFMLLIKCMVDVDMDFFSIVGVFLESNFLVFLVVEENWFVGRFDCQEMFGYMEVFMNEQDVEMCCVFYYYVDDVLLVIEMMQWVVVEFCSY